MAWAPPDGEALVNCSVVARESVRFHLWLGEKKLCYGRASFFGDSVETVIVERSAISNVVVMKESPWLRRGLAAFLVFTATFLLVASTEHDRGVLFAALIAYGMAVACVWGTGNQWRLSFSDGKEEHVISQPMARNRASMNVMAKAIQDVAAALE